MSFLSSLLDTSGFPRRWDCGIWTPEHGWLHILSDLGIWSAYLAIPCVLGYFALRRRDVPFPAIIWLFATFILACGTTHLMEAVVFWWPAYRLAGVIKLVTALASWATVIALVPIVPRALATRSPKELEQKIAERVRAEEGLRASEARFRGTFENAAVGIAHEDLTGRFLRFNERFCTILGHPPTELVGKTLSDVTHPEDLPADLAKFSGLRRGELSGYTMEKRFIRKDGTPVWADLTVSLQCDAEGMPAYCIKIIQDISERKRLEG